ncbi:MAG TPA: OsmC family protein [Candidatus Limnocylindrales bacterium]|jgi:putative redox protein|nr:OsmC family protein [Candidatus Limnocylindrales bacterium]
MAFHVEPSSGHPMDFDDRQSNTGASPVETVLSALAACSAMDVISIVTKKRQDVTGYWIDVVGLQRDEYPQVYTEVVVTHELEGRDLSEAAIRRAIELSALKYCPVNAMISAGATTVHHRYKIRSEGVVDYAVEGEVISTGPYRRPDVIAG